MKRLLQPVKRLAAVVLLALGLASVASPQCAMCKETAKYQKDKAIDSLKAGIVLLAIPPAAILGGIGWLTYRYRNASNLGGGPIRRISPVEPGPPEDL